MKGFMYWAQDIPSGGFNWTSSTSEHRIVWWPSAVARIIRIFIMRQLVINHLDPEALQWGRCKVIDDTSISTTLAVWRAASHHCYKELSHLYDINNWRLTTWWQRRRGSQTVYSLSLHWATRPQQQGQTRNNRGDRRCRALGKYIPLDQREIQQSNTSKRTVTKSKVCSKVSQPRDKRLWMQTSYKCG